jgi:hypothetical protein
MKRAIPGSMIHEQDEHKGFNFAICCGSNHSKCDRTERKYEPEKDTRARR